MRTTVVALVLLAIGTTAIGQPSSHPFRLEGLLPAGPRVNVTESWGTLRFSLTNTTDTPRDARVVVFYPEQSDVQYGRDVWLPPRATVSSWLTVGPAASESKLMWSRGLKFQLYEKTDGAWKQLPTGGDERLWSRQVPFWKREPSTCVVADDLPDEDAPPTANLPVNAAVEFARTFRLARGLSEIVTPVRDRLLPPTADAYDGTDQVVLAGNRLADDPAGTQGLRQWVQQGGTLWVLLDVVDLATVAPLLGDDCGFDVASRTGLTSVRLVRAGDDPAKAQARDYDAPVDFVRVRLGGAETVLYTTDGWPAAFVQPLGSGKVVVTTLGAKGWHRPRGVREAKSEFKNHPRMPVPQPELERLAVDIYPEPMTTGLKPSDLEPLITSEIGYKVVSRETAGAVLVGFVGCTLAAGLFLRRTRRPESVGWIAPLLAVVAAGAFVSFGLTSRRSVPSTLGVVAVVNAAPGTQEGGMTGLAAVYRPESGPVRITTSAGGLVDLDATGLEGQTRQLIQNDTDDRAWENMALPVGVRVGPVHGPMRLGGVTATARFGPDGLTGTFTGGEFRSPSDSILFTPSAEAFGVRLQADGGFALQPSDRLAAGEYLASGVVSDRQQRRAEVYQKLLSPTPKHLAGRTHLLAWVESTHPPVSVEGVERVQGSLLLTVPVSYNRTPPDTKVTVPLGFVPFTLVGPGKLLMETTTRSEQTLRFQLPPSVLPLTVERATIVLKARAPGRRIAVSGRSDGAKQLIHEVTNPLDAVRIDITDAKLLTLDADGGLRFDLAVGDAARLSAETRADLNWKVESLALEVVGTTKAK